MKPEVKGAVADDGKGLLSSSGLRFQLKKWERVERSVFYHAKRTTGATGGVRHRLEVSEVPIVADLVRWVVPLSDKRPI